VTLNPGDRGIDCASYQHPHGAPIDYAAVARAGYKFALVQISDGTSYLNPWAVKDARGFRAVGMEVGAYIYYEPTDSQDEQTIDAAKYYHAIGGWTLPLWIDVEVRAPAGWATLAKLIGDFRTNLIGATGTRVGGYFDLDFYDNLPGCPWGWDVWLADPSHPESPSKPCLIQQIGQGNVPGITGAVDLDVWRGHVVPSPTPAPNPSPVPLKKGHDMFLTTQGSEVFLVSGGVATHVLDPANLSLLQQAGVVHIAISAAQFALFTQVGANVP
jgi:lysozyme